MLAFWKWKEVSVCLSIREYAAAREALASAGIEYRVKTASHSDMPPFRSPARNLLGRVGENAAVSAAYYLYVKKSDYEAARHLLGRLPT